MAISPKLRTINNRIPHRQVYYFLLIFLAISLPLSPFGVTVAQIALVLNWLIERKFSSKFQILKNRKALLLFLSIFVIHLLGVLYTSDFKAAMHDLKIKLPLLLIPLVVGTSEHITKTQVKTIIYWFSASLVFVSINSVLLYSGVKWVSYIFLHKEVPVNDIRSIIISFSHIRFALLLNIAIFSMSYFLFYSKVNKRQIWFSIIVILWLTAFLFFLKSLTGIFVFVIIVLGVSIYKVLKIKYIIAKWFLIVGGISAFLLITSVLSHSIGKFYNTEIIDYEKVSSYTANGNKYFHDFYNKQIENGNYIWIYISHLELETAWNQRSKVDYKSVDLVGNKIKETVIRYLTSKGLRKDADGIAQLSDTDIKNIENGVPNYRYTNKYSLRTRLYMIIWQINTYLNGGNPSGGSITQRVEYVKAALHIISNNCWFGTGTGSQQNAFSAHYAKGLSKLDRSKQRRAHNQFLTIWITLGVFALFWFMHALIYPLIFEHRSRDFLSILILTISLLSMLNEDTLETQIGVSFIAYFYTLFVFAKKTEG